MKVTAPQDYSNRRRVIGYVSRDARAFVMTERADQRNFCTKVCLWIFDKTWNSSAPVLRLCVARLEKTKRIAVKNKFQTESNILKEPTLSARRFSFLSPTSSGGMLVTCAIRKGGKKRGWMFDRGAYFSLESRKGGAAVWQWPSWERKSTRTRAVDPRQRGTCGEPVNPKNCNKAGDINSQRCQYERQLAKRFSGEHRTNDYHKETRGRSAIHTRSLAKAKETIRPSSRSNFW